MNLDELEKQAGREPTVHQAADLIAADLGLPKGFIHQLNEGDDDWSFVIKCHALMESVLTLLLAETFGKPQVRDTLAGVETSKKIEMCSDLSLFDKEQRAFMRAMSKLRNNLVHNVDQVGFTFETYLKNKDVAKNFVSTFGVVWNDPVTIASQTVSREEISLENPKLTVWFSLVYLLGDVYIYRQTIEFEKHKSAVTEQLLEKYQKLMTSFDKIISFAGDSEWIPPAIAALKAVNSGDGDQVSDAPGASTKAP